MTCRLTTIKTTITRVEEVEEKVRKSWIISVETFVAGLMVFFAIWIFGMVFLFNEVVAKESTPQDLPLLNKLMANPAAPYDEILTPYQEGLNEQFCITKAIPNIDWYTDNECFSPINQLFDLNPGENNHLFYLNVDIVNPEIYFATRFSF